VKIAVCIKLVPSIEGQITIKDSTTGVSEDDAKIGINAYDEVALEQAVQLKEKGVATEVITYTISNRPKMDSTLRAALARGADRAVLINDDALANADAITVARVLAKAISDDEIGMVFCGLMATDLDGGQFPPMLAECLGWAQVTGVNALETDGVTFKAWRDIGSGSKALIAGSGPVVISCDKNLQKPRFIKLKDRRNAKKKPLDKKTLSDIEFEAPEMSVQYENWSLPSKKAECKFIEGDSQSSVNELVRLLREEAKVL
jgi:electron transfer flavoprotein beta subunit